MCLCRMDTEIKMNARRVALVPFERNAVGQFAEEKIKWMRGGGGERAVYEVNDTLQGGVV